MGVHKKKRGCFPSTMRALGNVSTGDGSQHKSGFLPTPQIPREKIGFGYGHWIPPFDTVLSDPQLIWATRLGMLDRFWSNKWSSNILATYKIASGAILWYFTGKIWEKILGAKPCMELHAQKKAGIYRLHDMENLWYPRLKKKMEMVDFSHLC